MHRLKFLAWKAAGILLFQGHWCGIMKALQIKEHSIYQSGEESALFGPVFLEVRVTNSGFV
jgi:hypothetical protein